MGINYKKMAGIIGVIVLIIIIALVLVVYIFTPDEYAVYEIDTTGNIVEGATMQVIDSSGEIVDEWVTTNEVKYLTNLEDGQAYTLHEEIAPEGYVYMQDIEFTVDYDEENPHIDLEDIMVLSASINLDEEIVDGVSLAVYDEDGFEVDGWTVGEQIIKLSDEEQVALQNGETITGSYYIEDITVEEELEDVTDEEGNLTDETEEEIHEEDYIFEVEYTITPVENEDYFLLKLVDTVATDFTDEEAQYFLINLDGTESFHMIRGLEEGKAYTLSEVEGVEGYEMTVPVEFVVNTSKEDQTVTITYIEDN